MNPRDEANGLGEVASALNAWGVARATEASKRVGVPGAFAGAVEARHAAITAKKIGLAAMGVGLIVAVVMLATWSPPVAKEPGREERREEVEPTFGVLRRFLDGAGATKGSEARSLDELPSGVSREDPEAMRAGEREANGK